jgi:hypothetical protein
MIEKLPDIVNRINKFSETVISDELALDFALKATQLRFKNKMINSDVVSLLEVTRKEDEGNNVWCVLNRLQEKLINGGFQYTNEKGKTRKARTLKNFTQNIEFNSELWELAESYMN